MSNSSTIATTASRNPAVSWVGDGVSTWRFAIREWPPGAAAKVSDAVTTLPASPSLWISSTANGMRDVVIRTFCGGAIGRS